MAPEEQLRTVERLSLWLACGAGALAVAAVAAVLAAALGPIKTDLPMATDRGKARAGPPAPVAVNIEPLKAQIARRRLFRSPEIKAAVKDSGAARRLLEQLKLHGVVRISQEYVAYIGVAEGPVRAVRKGQKLLEFTVDDVAPGRVILSLEGIEVILEH